MALFGSGKNARIQELEEQLEAAYRLLADERAKTKALQGEIEGLKAYTLEAHAADAKEILKSLEVASGSVGGIRRAVERLLEKKGILADVRERCSGYIARLTAAEPVIAAATVAYQQWNRLLERMQHSPSIPEVHSSAAFAAISEIRSLVSAMEAEQRKVDFEVREVQGIRRDFARHQELKDVLAEVARRERSRGPWNPKVLTVGLPHPDGHPHVIPKGIVGKFGAPPSMA